MSGMHEYICLFYIRFFFTVFQDKYMKDTEWKYFIELTRGRIASTTQQELQLLYAQIMKGKFEYDTYRYLSQ